MCNLKNVQVSPEQVISPVKSELDYSLVSEPCIDPPLIGIRQYDHEEILSYKRESFGYGNDADHNIQHQLYSY